MIIEEEKVNHPGHYNNGQYECIDVMVDVFGAEATKDFCLLNAFKYIWRHKQKNGVEDIRKAHWYLDAYIELYSFGNLNQRKEVEELNKALKEICPSYPEPPDK